MLVYPLKPGIIGHKHPYARVRPIAAGANDWPADGYTFRLLVEGALSETPPEPTPPTAEVPLEKDTDQ
jgi:hypothetical protein